MGMKSRAGRVDVAHDDSNMLEPEIGAVTPGWVRIAGWIEDDQFKLLAAQSHRGGLAAGAANAEQFTPCRAIMRRFLDDAEIQSVPIELYRPREIGNRPAHSRQPQYAPGAHGRSAPRLLTYIA